MVVGGGAICLGCWCWPLDVSSLANVLRTGSLVAQESGVFGWRVGAVWPSLAISELLRLRDGLAAWYLGTAKGPSLGVVGVGEVV